MVGSVLMQRMREERDFDLIDPVFYSTSRAGGAGPAIGRDTGALRDVLERGVVDGGADLRLDPAEHGDVLAIDLDVAPVRPLEPE